MKKEIFELLRARVAEKGVNQVAKDLGVSHSTVSLVIKGTYAASTANIEKKVMAAYGLIGIQCPVLGNIKPDVCAENTRKYVKLNLFAWNPDTTKLRTACRRCEVRI